VARVAATDRICGSGVRYAEVMERDRFTCAPFGQMDV
jgi:hypothetical protein